ncbi:hypothetical protein FP026_25400 [Rhizobium tropici]|uniref:Uncharacterized protein n=1 Tax=Rhizobium tropici TaxID=398 RepID=A0A5B0VRA0_RHITR|nr:hypothetical protein FP026_25400 [Rhizobium tropici]
MTKLSATALSWQLPRRIDEARTITLEIKRLSVVLIDERAGLAPRVASTLFKELFSAGPSGKLDRFLLDRRTL